VILFHLTTAAAWSAALDRGVYAPPSLAGEGFIHLSTARQWLRVLDRFYRDVPDQVLLTIDAARLSAPLSHEAADGDVFPHLYGPLDIAAVTDVAPLPGIVAMPEGLDGALRADPTVATTALCIVKLRDGWAACVCLGGATREATATILLRDAQAAVRAAGLEATLLQYHGDVDPAVVARLIDGD